MVAPRGESRSVTGLRRRSEPETFMPRLSRISAMPLMPMPPIPMKCACWEVANILDAKVKGTIRACRRGSLADAAKVPLKLKEGMRTEEKHAGRTVETTGNEVEVKRRSTTRTEPKSCAF